MHLYSLYNIKHLIGCVGPTGYAVTYTQVEDIEYPLVEYTVGGRVFDFADNQCTPQTISYANRYLTYVTQYASVAVGQTSLVVGYTFNTTLIGPTAVSNTLTYDLYGDEYDLYEAGQDPHARCHLRCGQCFITFPVVRVSIIPVLGIVPILT